MTPPRTAALRSPNGDAGAAAPDTADSSTFTLIAEHHPNASLPWSLSIHRKDGQMVDALAGSDPFEVLAAAASKLARLTEESE